MPKKEYGIESNKSGVYMIKNIINNKLYIGSAIKLNERLSNHFHMLKNNKHHSIHLQNAWNLNKYYFVCGVIEYVSDYKKLNIFEQKYIDLYNSSNQKYGYNICPLAKNNLGSKHQKGIEEKRKRMLGSGNNFYGKKHSLESLKKISEFNGQKKLSNKDVENIKILYKNGNMKQHELAKIYNVGRPYISKIINNKKRNKIY